MDLDAGQSQNIKVVVSVPDTESNGRESPTEITVTASSRSDITESVTIVTVAEEESPDWTFSMQVIEEGNLHYDEIDCGCFVIKDKEEIEIKITLTNDGNQQNNFNLAVVSDEVPSPFLMTLEPNFISSLNPGQSAEVVLTMSPTEEYEKL